MSEVSNQEGHKTPNGNVEDPPGPETVLEDFSDETKCGFGSYRPDWLQALASKKTYVIVYGLLGMNQSAIGAYFIGTISTIEKRFKMPSTSTGMISSAWDIGAMCSAMIMAYFGSSGHKTRWVSAGAVIAAISCIMRYIPHMIYGPGIERVGTGVNGSIIMDAMCNEGGADENCSLNTDASVAFAVLFLAHIALGTGTSTYYTLGAAYLDDNALKDKVPFLFAVSTSLRYIGPTVGYMVASYALNFYIDPEVTPSFGRNDPRWIGAWWYGWLPFGFLHLGFALLMSFFPKTLPREAIRRQASFQGQARNRRSLNDFKETIWRLVKNPVLMYNSFSSTFYIFGMVGYWIFMPKYIETQFRVSASEANLVTGSVGLICTAIGVMSSGAIVSKFRPRPTYLAAWNVFTESIDVLGHLVFAFLGCHKEDLHGSWEEDGSWGLITDCNANCACDSSIKYSPVCSSDGSTTFFSACHAGCTSVEMINGTKYFTNCSCIPGLEIAKAGPCPVECSDHFTIFLVLLCLLKFLSATGRSGNTIIQFRAVDPKDKSISIAMTEVLMCAIAFIPAPIIYGMILDYSCQVWGVICGERGNCWLYEGVTLRYLLNFTVSGFLLIATLLDVGVLCNVKDLKIYDEDVAEKKEEGQKMKAQIEQMIETDSMY